jgi:hypothetical protein
VVCVCDVSVLVFVYERDAHRLQTLLRFSKVVSLQ